MMNKTIHIYLVLLLILVPALNLFGQEKLGAVSGGKIRVWVSDTTKKPLSGTLVSLNTHTLVLRVKKQEAALSLPVTSVTKLELVIGKKRFGIKKGAGLGFLAGAITGAVIGFNTTTSGECFDFCPTETFYGPFFAIVGGGFGIMTGSFIGAALKTERWQEVPIAELSVVSPKETGLPKRAKLTQNLPQSIYVEAFGGDLDLSINYERMFTDAVGGRFGVIYIPSTSISEARFRLLFTTNYLVGSSNHKLEMDAGVIVNLNSGGIRGFEKETGGRVTGTIFFGYRYQPMKTGLLFRIGVSSNTSNRLFPWLGLNLGFSLGITF